MSDFSFKTATELQSTLRDTKAAEALDSYYKARIEKLNPSLNAVLRTGHMASGKKGKLSGVPFLIKDNICVKGWEVTCASRILKGFISPYHATVIEKLLEEGAVLLGQANMDEFAFGSSCETSCYGPTKNPWNNAHTPGGSSGGSAAAVSADFCTMALGSDTGGSIRQPASLCGIVGLKPTYGRVSRFGLVAFGSSLDQIGPLSRSVKDAALCLGAIAGFDPKDSTSLDVKVPDYMAVLGESVKGMRVGIPKEYFDDSLAPDVKSQIDEAIQILVKEGVELVSVSLPHTRYAVPTYYVIAPSEASSNLARFDGVKYGLRSQKASDMISMYNSTREEGLGREAKRRILLGTYALSSGYYDEYYLKAMRVRSKMVEDFDAVFKKVDCLVTPTSPTGAFKLGEKMNDPWAMYLSDMYTISANLSGVPAISVPCGLTADGLPVGVQFMAKAFDEASLFKMSYAFESKSKKSSLRPKLA
jgi:aspartyl-tRNA(Asn)/glutamyl-tRNA(Gln) amidotransferase subunit A